MLLTRDVCCHRAFIGIVMLSLSGVLLFYIFSYDECGLYSFHSCGNVTFFMIYSIMMILTCIYGNIGRLYKQLL